MQRFSGASPVSSPNRPNYPKSSPLSKVAEEIPSAQVASPLQGVVNTDVSSSSKPLVEIGTPRASDEEKRIKAMESLLDPPPTKDDKENVKADSTSAADSKLNGNATKQATVEDDSVMKTIEI